MMLGSVIFLFIFIPLLAFILLGLSILLGTHRPDAEKDAAFECGFDSFLTQNRTEFNISFFIVGLLFLLFDIEIILIYPYAISAYNNSYVGLFFAIIFLLILTAGFAFELGRDAIEFKTRQTGYLASHNTSGGYRDQNTHKSGLTGRAFSTRNRD